MVHLPKYALITGASRGIGKETARLFASRGYHLYLVCHTCETALSALKKELEDNYGISCTCFCGDIQDVTFVDTIFSQISSLDVLLNNAGIAYYGLLQDMQPEAWSQILQTNLSAAFLTSRKAIPLMLRQSHGRILNVSSVWGNVGASMEVAYSASKGGLNAFTRALAKELAPSGISVNAIACGLVDTDMNRHLTPDDLRALCDEIPAGRMATTTEVAEMILSIAEAPQYLTGQVITFDGGWT